MATSASPALVEDDTRPDIGSVAVLTMAPSVTAHTSGDRSGVELVDAVASGPAGMGFALVASFGSAELAACFRCCPTGTPPSWTPATCGDPRAGRDVVYDGDLGHPPRGWRQALHRSGHLVVRAGSTLALDRGDRCGQLTAASRAGEIVGAQLPLT